ncbi:MAG: ZIP family metal transporter [Candidatus Aenigmarchaeota archaeon]|nr:ZIP family metal transporter [Candidatus Aenigmarchaeota archaeon]
MILSVIVVSLLSFVGVLALAIKKNLNKILRILVGFAAGSMAGASFLVLLPEAIKTGSSQSVFLFMLLGIIAFFILENFLHWYHCHKGNCKVHRFTYLNLVGDGLHNFLDGMVIAASYLVSLPIGIVTTIAVIAHEIPQELGDFGVLIYGGLSKKKALFYNFLSALTAVVGALFVYIFKFGITNYYALLIAFAAGNFIYIATADLIPELHKETKIKKSVIQLILFLFGVFMIWFVGTVFVEG